MKYGVDMVCLREDGSVSPRVLMPNLLPFFYDDGDWGWYLTKDFTILVVVDGRVYMVTAKAWFDYDGASIPRVLRSIVGDKMAHDILVAALFHDLFYCAHHPVFPKNVSDWFLAGAMEPYGANRVKRTAVKGGVMVFGKSHWTKTPEEIAKYSGKLIITDVTSHPTYTMCLRTRLEQGVLGL